MISSSILLSDPPDGVDISALGPNGERMYSPEECEALYQDAFDAAGGTPALERNASLAADLEKQLVKEVAIVAQNEAWQCYDLRSMMDSLGHGPVREFGVKMIEELAQEICEGPEPEAELSMGDVKKWERASMKTHIKYGSDCSRLVDLNRATLVCPTIDGMYAAASQLFSRWGPNQNNESARVVEWEDHYQKPMPGGYRHLQVLVRLGGSVWEMQLTTRPMMEAKHAAGHKLYKTTRFVKEMILFTAMEGNEQSLHRLLGFKGVRDVANPNDVSDLNGLTALHHAAFRGDTNIVCMLRDPAKVVVPANLWRLSKTRCLPLNLAMQMRRWNVAEALLDAMLQEGVPSEGVRSAVVQSLARACFAGIDSHKEVPSMLPKLMLLWVASCPPAWSGRRPLEYCFRHGSELAQQEVLGFADLWQVDKDGKLPIEIAVRSKFNGTAKYLIERMPDSKPKLPARAAIASLARCRSHFAVGLEDLIEDLSVGTWQIFTCGSEKAGASPRMQQLEALRLKEVADMNLTFKYSCFAVDSTSLYAGGRHGVIDVWDLSDNFFELVYSFEGHTQFISELLLGSRRKWPDGRCRVRRLFSASCDNWVRIWDLYRRSCLIILPHHSDVVALARYGSYLFCASGREIVCWNVMEIKRPHDMKAGVMKGHHGFIDVLCVNGNNLFCGGTDGLIHAWNLQGARKYTDAWQGHSADYRITCIQNGSGDEIWSAAHATGASCTNREFRTRPRHHGPSEILRWSSTGECLMAVRDQSFFVVHLSWIDGLIYLASSLGKVSIWDGETLKEMWKMQVHEHELVACAMGQLDEDESEVVANEDLPLAAVSSWPGQADVDELKARFSEEDGNHDGRLSLHELAKILQKGDSAINTTIVQSILSKMDGDNDGSVSFHEFVDFLFE